MNRQQRRAAAKPGRAATSVPALDTRNAAVAPRVVGLFNAGFQHHQAGRLSEAEACYRQVLAAHTDHAETLHLLGVVAYQTKRYDEAVELIGRAIAQDDRKPAYFSHLGNALTDQGKLDEAAAAYRRAIAIGPEYADAWSNLGSVLKEQGKLEEAVAACRRAIGIRPDYAEAHCNLGNALGEQGKLEEAIAACREALGIKPELAAAHFILGNALKELGRLDDAIAAYRRVIGIRPDHAEAHCNLGSALQALGRLDEAVAAYRRGVDIAPDHAAAFSNLGDVLRQQGKVDEAIAACRQAIAIDPDLVAAHCNLGIALKDQGSLDEAVASYKRAIGIDPELAEVYSNLGNALQAQGKLDEAVAAYSRAVDIAPDYAAARSALIQLRRRLCDWSERATEEAQLLDLVAKGQRIPPFILLDISSKASDQLVCARRWAEGLQAPGESVFAQYRSPGDARIRIGYLSADLRIHPVALLIAEVFERHDRSRFEVFAYSYGPDDRSELRRRLERSFDRFVDLRELSHDAAARRIHDDGIDILVDLTGYTQFSRTQILAMRPAPIQVNFLGYPGTMGARFIDYLVADPVVLPFDQQPYYDEKIVHLPDCYQPNDSKRAIADRTPSRAECGLPERGFVFCCFNHSYKITPEVFDIWMRLLGTVPGSVLWLLESTPSTRANLAREAAARGIAAERLVFGPRMALAEHLARHRLADLFLDTLPYNAHTTASDALWAGLPVLTCAGDTFAGRVAASLLRAVGLPELITASLDEYQALALHLAGNPAFLAGLRSTLARNRASAPLFDSLRFTRHLEAAFSRMHATRCAGEAPRPFAVEALNAEPTAQETNALIALFNDGRYAEAASLARTMTARFPRHGFGWKVLGTALLQLSQNADALAAMQTAAALSPEDPEAHNTLGNALKRLGRLKDAEIRYRHALEIRPDYVEAHYNLGNTLKDLGRLDEAEAAYRRALASKSDFAEAHNSLGNTLKDLGRPDEAEASYRQALQIRPDHAEAHNNLGVIFHEMGRLEDAESRFRRAIQIRPDYARAYNNLGTTFQDLNRMDEAVASYRRALEIKPDFAEAHSNLLMCLNYLPHLSAAEIHAEHRRWDEQQTAGCDRIARPARDRNPQRRLRVGYVSPDLRQHSVAYFFEPLLREHDRQVVEVFCYAEVACPDAVTARLQSLSDHWLRTVGMSDAELAQRIAEDRIDILVDLAGHTPHNRLHVFARQPAPVQVSWLGYPHSTGLRAMDYRLVDAVTDPAGEADDFASETLIRLERGFLCYGAPADAPPPATPPSLASGSVTFGSFNNPAKLSSVTLDAWAMLLARVPGSRLLLKGKRFTDVGSNAAFLAQLQQRGVDAGRVTLLGFASSPAEHLALYERVDIALDPFPYNGTTTTCEALWMGVPVVSLRGDRHAARVGASLLAQIGLGELVAASVQDYLDIAARLAGDAPRLTELHRTLRARLAASPLCDAPAFARRMEAAYRGLWQHYCKG